MNRLLPFALALLATGCAAAPPTLAPTAVPGATGPVTVRSQLALQDAKGFKLMTYDGPRGWQADDVHHVLVYLKRDGGPEVPLGPKYEFNTPIAVANLRMNTAYQVRLEAYTAWDQRIDADAAPVGSSSPLGPIYGLTGYDPGPVSSPGGCTTAFTTTTQTYQDLPDGFALRLIDQTFEGKAAGKVDIEPGKVNDPEQPEVLIPAELPS